MKKIASILLMFAFSFNTNSLKADNDINQVSTTRKVTKSGKIIVRNVIRK